MHIDRIYEKYVSETPTEVVVLADNKHLVLNRNRMYNSHVDIKGFLYTDYAEREYKQHNAHAPDKDKPTKRTGPKLTPEQRVEAAKKGWAARKARGI